ncbi:hypothetical protein ATY77_30190 [Rhizobium sp. R634]|uniref:hypothetical protein n=1 Tax=Rhizobium sp. R634 TaxID=1764274 RepID=UPI000B53534C|nr:hypothetical protein [Rhizobium sp. R634]OWV77642.1 hypothetical protein ATY77_30190 [Rhizobium sp. R634]
MNTVYISRNAVTGKLNGIFYGRPESSSVETLPEEHPDVQAYLHSQAGFPVLYKWQLWLAALELEPPVYKADILQAISALADKTSQEKEAIRIMVEDIQAYHREDPRIDLLGQAMRITPVQMDDLWRWAALIQPAS